MAGAFFPPTSPSSVRSLTCHGWETDAGIDSPYRTGRHVPLNRNSGLAGVTTASDSRADINSPYLQGDGRGSTMSFDTAYGGRAISPMPSPANGGPYSPGLVSQRQSVHQDAFDVHSPTGEIPMQNFQNGGPPPPPVASSWEKIDRWAEENYPELFDQLGEGCTVNDLNELEYQLDCTLPQDLRQSLQIHDGQERGGLPTGIIFSSMLLDCEEMVQEWENWKTVNQEFMLDPVLVKRQSQAFAAQASSSKDAPNRNQNWRQELLNKQDSVPPSAIQKAYAHPAWIPLVRDWGGNNLAVDLAPGPKGHWGQIILFGRDYDTKYVVARSWAHFLAMVAEDLSSGRWFVDEDTNELKLREFKATRVEPSYFEILRWRMDQKYGRTANKRKSMAPSMASASGMRSPPTPGSPYQSPTEHNEPRGRSLHRLTGTSPMSSPIRPGYGKPSPLARVAEEAPPTTSLTASNASLEAKAADNLMELNTPRTSGEHSKEDIKVNEDSPAKERTSEDKEKKPETEANGKATESKGKQTTVEDAEDMKDIEI
ncbi:hypothetical protein NEUTE1DRAFT_127256 [Neurospora tetrasperma FGSC 2508]|uniref:Knr4/Smi1-like domain-containing protein n=1 Tax=Neurospora tetrasperma (strain FGSC 2508 / ATCC MYA-4615 / P0657) TaxID=510951 RepID=F8MC11_NEUT8|nr:uncharacterized protein NEUTE1DRAFT_127256 [Neurospora tetrasperma FGSC 2508]EGO60365.1 hypothetical protein NEUTE1DRAFT_127256 [Neurospora tetrasperma FGSC 2508]EGZ75661.1 cell wall assembly and cell proliferation coordinating protein [Neurospora tetrasperma FGSC 2509]